MYVDQEFIKKWKKWILDIARFETTTMITNVYSSFAQYVWPYRRLAKLIDQLDFWPDLS